MNDDVQCATASNTLFYVCKYTPVELLQAMGAECSSIDHVLDGFDLADEVAGANICGFGKTVLELALSGKVRQLVLVGCCDVIRSVYDVLEDWSQMDFLHIVDLPHCNTSCARELLASECLRLARAYGKFAGAELDVERFRGALLASSSDEEARMHPSSPYVGVLGARMGSETFAQVQSALSMPARNLTCAANRDVRVDAQSCPELDSLMLAYTGALFEQTPCMRMADTSGRQKLADDPAMAGIVYHTVKFCDFYSFEYAELAKSHPLPMVKVESDWTTQSSGQLATRIEAFGESLGAAAMRATNPSAAAPHPTGADTAAPHPTAIPSSEAPHPMTAPVSQAGSPSSGEHTTARSTADRANASGLVFAGIDSGSTSTDVVLLDANLHMVSASVVATGAGASASAERALQQAMQEAGIDQKPACVVATGYGRSAVDDAGLAGSAITEITCHARGARNLFPEVRTVIDIGGQDSKVIALDPDGNVTGFAMNDKCAAGTGRFLEMMARTLQMELDELSRRGCSNKSPVTISSTCSVFAESEVVSLIARNVDVDSIVLGICKSVASRVQSLVRRTGGGGPYMMTGGVSRNAGIARAIEAALGEPVTTDPRGQLCGALGAALIAAASVGR